MNIRSIRNIALGGLVGAAIGFGGVAAIKTVLQTGAETASISGDDPNNPDSLPLEMLRRIDFLLEKQQLPCDKNDENIRYTHLKAALCNGIVASFNYRIDLPEWEQLGNCHAAAFWAATGAGGLDNQMAMAFPECLPELLGKYGFSRIADAAPSKALMDLLLPGDFLLYILEGKDMDILPFYYKTDFKYHVDHSAIYVGEDSGQQLIFQKRGLGCGSDYKFELALLDFSLLGNYPSRIMAYRKE